MTLSDLKAIAMDAVSDRFFYFDMEKIISVNEEEGSYSAIITNKSINWHYPFNPQLVLALLEEIEKGRKLVDNAMCGFINNETDKYDTARARVDSLIGSGDTCP